MSGKKLIGFISFFAILITISSFSADAQNDAKSTIVYANSNLNFSLTLPISWAGLYRAEEYSDGVSFINIRNENAGAGGKLFEIHMTDGSESADLSSSEIAVNAGKHYYFSLPTDLQYAFENDALFKEYASMEKDVGAIIETFRVGPVNAVARPTTSEVLVNGKAVSFEAYGISGNNYFKLRDLASVLSGTSKQFEVVWDSANNAISLTSGKPYTPVGGEMERKSFGSKTARPTTSRVLIDGKETFFTAYNIEGNNYFKLRDIGLAFNFSVEWRENTDTVVIDTGNKYSPESGQ